MTNVNQFNHYLEAIHQASHRLGLEDTSPNKGQVAIKTPLDRAPKLSERLGMTVLLKREDMQPVFSFKLRGAYNKMAAQKEMEPADEFASGFITASAGNHAQGVAFAAHQLQVKATIVMPQTTPAIKIDAVKRYGGQQVKIVLHGDHFPAALERAGEIAKEKEQLFVHPYDDEAVIAGQGTVGKELFEQATRLDKVFVPVGGGGLLAGIAVYLKQKNPNIKIIGVESDESACLAAARHAGHPVVLPQVGIFADGVAVAMIGGLTFAISQQYVDDVITVSTDEICAAIKDIFEETRTLAEPAGALALAGLKKYAEKSDSKTQNEVWTAIVSGANVNFDRLRYIAERTELGEKRESLLAVTIPEQPGSFLKFCQLLGRRAITEFNYRYADTHEAHIFVGVKCQDRDAELPPLLALLRQENYPVVDLSNNEMAKLHIRYMVGGHTQYIEPDILEALFRVEFPERPGALLDFLQKLGDRWNISLFHYRNHGAAFGRVLVGFQVANKQKPELIERFTELGYPFHEESDNPAYKLFLD